MLNLLLTGRCEDGKTPEFLQRQLSRLLEPNTFRICDTDYLEDVGDPRTIVIFKQSFCGQNAAGSLRGCTAVAGSENREALMYLKDQSVRTIACGLSERDTVTLASSTADSAVIGLQREILTLDDEPVEPSEYPVRFRNPPDEFPLLCLGAVLLLSGNRALLDQITIE